jgi:tetratricopeptide (TPR) repeat protein
MSDGRKHIQEVRNQANTLIENITYQLRDRMLEIKRIDLLVETLELVEKYHRENDVVVRFGYEERTAQQLRVRVDSLLNIGLVASDADDPEAALKHFKAAEEHAEALFAMAREDVERSSAGGELDTVYKAIAITSEKSGDNDRAESYYEKRVELWQDIMDNDDSILSVMHHRQCVNELETFLDKEDESCEN